MILVRSLTLLPGESPELLPARAAEKLRCQESRILSWSLVKRSLDARKKDRIRYVCSVALEVSGDEGLVLRRQRGTDAVPYTEPQYPIPSVHVDERPLVVGFGPAGMFAALVLSLAGLRPLVIERGQDVQQRRLDVERFQAGGALNPESNVQFGEGGAGTFSDGKLNTGTHDKRIFWVLRQFRAHGAPEEILYDAKPHIGTDILTHVVRSIREEILALGGEVRFGCRLDSLCVQDGQLAGVYIRDASASAGTAPLFLPCRHAILAIGHSARDTFEALHGQRIPLERKPFAMGVRIEHLQAAVNRAQYGTAGDSLPPADYSLHTHLSDGTGVFTFCMCPGGHVIASASEPGGIVTNGMSYSGRAGTNANAALLAGVRPEDFPGEGVLAGMYWQRSIEQSAFLRGDGSSRAPAQRVEDFLKHQAGSASPTVSPTYRPGVYWDNLHCILPSPVAESLMQALPLLERHLAGFADPDAILTGPETRSSSPVRILRGKDLSSPVQGLYPCGEGAGYAGGITSAAVDGMRCAEAVITALSI